MVVSLPVAHPGHRGVRLEVGGGLAYWPPALVGSRGLWRRRLHRCEWVRGNDSQDVGSGLGVSVAQDTAVRDHPGDGAPSFRSLAHGNQVAIIILVQRQRGENKRLDLFGSQFDLRFSGFRMTPGFHGERRIKLSGTQRSITVHRLVRGRFSKGVQIRHGRILGRRLFTYHPFRRRCCRPEGCLRVWIGHRLGPILYSGRCFGRLTPGRTLSRGTYHFTLWERTP